MSLHIEIADDDAAFAVIKLKRGTLHPGVLAAFMTEAGVPTLDYTRGKKNHVWRVTAEQMAAFKAHLATFTVEGFRERAAELRKVFPATSAGHLTPQAQLNLDPLASLNHTPVAVKDDEDHA